MQTHYTQPDPNLWQGRIDPETTDMPLHWHQTVQFLDLENSNMEIHGQADKIAFLGYACEAGVARNGGRIGAAIVPDSIRKQLAKLPIHGSIILNLFDAGTVCCHRYALETTQETTANCVSNLLEHHFFSNLARWRTRHGLRAFLIAQTFNVILTLGVSYVLFG